MESFIWGLSTRDVFLLVVPFFFLHVFLTFSVLRPDYFLLLAGSLWRRAVGERAGAWQAAALAAPLPSGAVIIPSLLRDGDDFAAITTTITSAGNNGYPSEIHIVAAVDGRTEHPDLYRDLGAWVRAQTFPANVRVHVTGTDTRLGKMMAVESGVTLLKRLVTAGHLGAFPSIYFSIDGDGTLGPHALERLGRRLSTRHRLTGNLRRIVSGKLAIRPDVIWRGWRAFFTVSGQLYMQVAREFVVSNLMRFNRKLTPQIGVPGALYCCWSDLLLMAPHYMGFMRTVRPAHWLKWWLGGKPPLFSESNAPSVPEALTGASDDTCLAFLASLASWRNGKLSLDAPRTPLHSLGRLFIAFFIERSHAYEPEARIYTFTPSTVKGLWVQRVRWNSSRFECTGRFFRAFWFHWEIGFPTALHLSLVLQNVARFFLYYVLVPMWLVGSGHRVLGFAFGYAFHVAEDVIYTAIAFAIERDYRRCWRSVLCMPFAPLYTIVYSNLACAYGVAKDLLLFGNPTKFAPEWTLIKGQTSRVALAYRARRFLALAFRAVVRGDVPFGSFWWGWTESPYTANGFEGWTTGKNPGAAFAWPAPPASPALPASPGAMVNPLRPALARAATAAAIMAVRARRRLDGAADTVRTHASQLVPPQLVADARAMSGGGA